MPNWENDVKESTVIVNLHGARGDQLNGLRPVKKHLPKRKRQIIVNRR